MPDLPQGSERARDSLAFLRRKIVSGEWPINSKIPKEPELMELMGVGKSTVREAVRSLASVGMLETVRGVGTFVRSSSPVSAILTDYISEYGLGELLTYRRALEIEAAQLAAVNRTDEQVDALRSSLELDISAGPEEPRTESRGTTPGPFHHLIFEASGSALLTSLYSGVMTAIRRAISEGKIAFGSSHEVRQMDHAALLDAIENQDIAKAAHTMALHVDRDLILIEEPAHVAVRREALLLSDVDFGR